MNHCCREGLSDEFAVVEVAMVRYDVAQAERERFEVPMTWLSVAMDSTNTLDDDIVVVEVYSAGY